MLASVLRISGRSGLALCRNANTTTRPFILSKQIGVASISTSKKSRDGSATTIDPTKDAKPAADDFSYEAAKKKWVTYGFSWISEEEDKQTMNFCLFMTITVALVGIGFWIMYFPDVRRHHWTQREAFIELARREALGLPLIDENLVPPENINLPTEEELGDFEIII